MEIALYKQAGIQLEKLENVMNCFITSTGYIEVLFRGDKQKKLYKLSDYFAFSIWNE